MAGFIRPSTKGGINNSIMQFKIFFTVNTNPKKDLNSMKNIKLIFRVASAFLMILLLQATQAKASEFPSADSPEVQPKNNEILEEMQNFLFEENGIMDQVNHELLKEGYKTRTALVYYSKEDIQLKFLLVDKEATATDQEKVKSIFFELIQKNNLDPNAFTIDVGNESDGPGW